MIVGGALPITSSETFFQRNFAEGRVHARDSRSPARSGSNPLTAGVAPFPPAATRQPLTRRLSPSPRAVDLPSPTYPPNYPAPAPPTLLPSPPPSPSRNRRSSRRRAGVYYRGNADPLPSFARVRNLAAIPFFFLFLSVVFFER